MRLKSGRKGCRNLRKAEKASGYDVLKKVSNAVLLDIGLSGLMSFQMEKK